MQNKKFLSVLTGKFPQFHFKVTRTKLFLFGLTLVAFGFGLGVLGTVVDDADVASKVVNLGLPERLEIQATLLK